MSWTKGRHQLGDFDNTKTYTTWGEPGTWFAGILWKLNPFKLKPSWNWFIIENISAKHVLSEILHIYMGRNFITQYFWPFNVPKSAILLASCKFFQKQNHFFSPCSHKIYPLSTNLKQSSALRTFSMGVYQTPEIGCFCYFPKYCILIAIISQLVKKLQQ